MDMSGKTAIVTGGSGYIGSQICSTLTELGAKVISISRGISNSFSETEHSNIIKLKYDLSTKDGVDRCLNEIKNQTREIDLLVNNFYTFPKKFNILDQEWVDIETTLNASIISPLYLTKLILQIMIDNETKGNIINIASMYGKIAPDFNIYDDQNMQNNIGVGIEYCIAKAGLIASTKYIASYFGDKGIRCNSISPGPFSKPGTFNDKGWFKKNIEKRPC